jgi:SecD/SecF fusion protein
MQNKTAITTFTILLALACIYQLSFTWIVSRAESKASQIAVEQVDSVLNSGTQFSIYQQDSMRQKFEGDYLLGIANEKTYPLLGFTYRECKQNEINLGLDLQGGMNVILEVSVIDLIKVMSGNSDDPVFNKAINLAEQRQATTTKDFTTLFGEAVIELDPNFKLAAVFHSRENKDLFPSTATNEEVLAIIRSEAEDAVKRTEQVLRKRIDNLGVVQPKIQRLSASDRIAVELPGVKDKTRVRKILQGTAKLEFWEVYDNREIFKGFEDANTYLREQKQRQDRTADTLNNSVDTLLSAALLNDSLPSDSNNLLSQLSADSSAQMEGSDLLSELAGDSATADTGATSLADFAKENPLYALVQPVIYQDPQTQQYLAGQGPVVGYVSEKNRDEVNRLLNSREIIKFFPPNIRFLWSAKPVEPGSDAYTLFAIRKSLREDKARLEGDAVTNARVTADPLGNPEVSLIMNGAGAKTWREMTAEASADPNNKKSIAIVLDDLVYSAPTVQSEIKGGQSSISGNFTPEEAEDLANVLKAGKLPAPANIIEEAIVGPSLGQEAINSGLISFVIALLLVLAYMWLYYAKAGAVADIALMANIFFVFGVLASLGATLTLSGIAGIVLTIGMSVDANVLIYERIREEVSAGKGLKLAIADGYRNAYSSIIDANITTLLTGIVLLMFGTGPIKGFATTLIIGICTSLFSAIFITRLIFERFLAKKETMSFSTRWSENIFNNINWQFVGKRRLYYLISGVIILAGIASLATRGLNYGVDFTGGRSYLVRMGTVANVEAIGSALQKVFVNEDGTELRPEVKIYGSSNQVKITTQFMIGERGIEADEMVESKLKEGISVYSAEFEVLSSQMVEPTIAEDIKQSALWAIVFALVIIFGYIVLRFRKWQFGLGALVAMFHDVLVVLSVFSIFYGVLPFSLEIDQAFIAAILTVIGYSINDTVVVYDRIRENLANHKKRRFNVLINEALNSTLSRTINTSMTTFVVLLIIFLFGGEVIRGFIFALMVGIVVGTYSSVCIATPILVDTSKPDPERLAD